MSLKEFGMRDQVGFDWDRDANLSKTTSSMQLLTDLIVNKRLLHFNRDTDFLQFSEGFCTFQYTTEIPESFRRCVLNLSHVANDVRLDKVEYVESDFDGSVEDYIGTAYLLKGFLDEKIGFV